MDRIIEILKETLLEIENNQKTSQEELDNIKKSIELLDNAYNDLDSIDVNSFKNIFPEESKTIDDLLLFKGWFSSNSEESQIVEASTNLKEMINFKKKELDEKSSMIISNNQEELYKKYSEVLEILSSYNQDKYITLEEESKIYEAFSLIGITEDLFKVYLEIAINNRNIEKTRKKEIKPVLTEEEIRDVETALEEINTPNEESKYEGLMKKFRNTENGVSPSYIDVKELLESDIYDLINSIMMNITEEDIQKMESLVELIDAFGLEECSGPDLVIGSAIKLLDAFESKSIDEIKEIISIYKRKKLEEEKEKLLEEKAEEFIQVEGLKEYSDLVNEVKRTYDIGRFLDIRYIQSYEGISKEDLKESMTDTEYYKFCIAKTVHEMEEILSLNENTEEIMEMLSNLRVDLDTAINSYNKFLISKKTEPTLYDQKRENGEPFNYFVLFDEDTFWDYYKTEKISSGRTTKTWSKHVKELFDEIMEMTDVKQIRENAHNVHISTAAPNPYEILGYRHGETRLLIRVLEAPIIKINGAEEMHNVIIVFYPVYGSKDKEDVEGASINLFKNNLKRYEELRKIFSSKGNVEDQLKELGAGLLAYKNVGEYASGGKKL